VYDSELTFMYIVDMIATFEFVAIGIWKEKRKSLKLRMAKGEDSALPY
jgi:hypothetical protein